MRTAFVCSVALVVAAITLSTVGCAESDALRLFTDKGLVVLQPAKTWVTVGGLFVVASKGKPGYTDRAVDDPILSDPNSLVAGCQEVFGAEQREQTMAFSAAVNAIAKIVPWSGGLQAKDGITVHLEPITSPCVRLNTRVLTTLVNEPVNKPVILNKLHAKGNKGVYLVMQVDSTTQLTLSADHNSSMEASYQGQGKLLDCTTPLMDANGTNSSKGKQQATNAADTTTKAGQSTPQSVPIKAANANTKTPTAAGDNSKGAGGAATALVDSGISASACMATSYRLAMTSTTPVPFAVRLSKVYENPPNSGVLDIQETGFKFPAGTLGAGSELEQATAKVTADLLSGGYDLEPRSNR